MRYVLILFALLTLQSCFLSRSNRADRRVRKAMMLDPERFYRDTVLVRDTVIINNYVHDTIKQVIYHDTVTVINNDRVSLKYYYDTTRLEIWHEVECKGDTVYLENEIIVEKVVNKSTIPKWVIICAAIAAILLAFISLRKK